jgi:hypothetical protein
MARPSRVISLGRDNLVRYAKAADFYGQNPGLQPIEAQLKACITEYDRDVAAKGCTCKANPNLLTPGLNAMLSTLMDAKETNPSIAQDFVRYVSKAENTDGIRVTIYYRALTGASELVRYDLP